MEKGLVIGIDIGTTNIKAVLFNMNGAVISESIKTITTYHPTNNQKEQDSLEIEYKVKQAIKQVIQRAKIDPRKLLSIGISCAMHSIICVDKNNNPLSPMLIWSDGRGHHQLKLMTDSTIKRIYKKTGTPAHNMSPLFKLMWMKQEKFKPFQKAHYFMTLKDFLIKRWFDRRIIDYSMASSTGLVNINTLDWEQEALNLAGIQEDQLSEIVPPTEVLTSWKESIAKFLGIQKDLPFAVGAADGQLANLGNGAISSDEINISVGTSGAVRKFVKGVPKQKHPSTFVYPFTKSTSIIGGPTNNGGIALQWFKTLIEHKGTFDSFLKSAENINIGADGMIFLPYINGERAPLWNQQAKGVFYGLSMNHTKEHMVRAVLEGISFNLYKISELLEKEGNKYRKISVNGGLSQSSVWLEMLADIFGNEINVSNTSHSVAWGAAWTSLVATNKVETFVSIKENIPQESIIHPNLRNHKLYKQSFEKFKLILNQLYSCFS
ncbi:MAG TPA: gluconokinase [Virgibacillus sp.]|nr:gluconokinase [Virgibacillus sp.]HLR66675.1 gluconokinase [Virgibacillus sp.]